MADWPAVLFNESESYALADLTGAATDLSSTIALCQLYIDEAQRDQPGVHILEAVCAAALVRYGRALGSGVRTGLQVSDVLAGLAPEDREMNRDFKDLRDKWIAHSVNAFEENDVLLWLMPLERGQMEIMDATVRERRVIRLSEEGMVEPVYPSALSAGSM